MKNPNTRKKRILFAIFIIFLLVLSFSCSKKDVESGETAEGIEEFGPILDLGEMIVNLSDTGQARYAKMVVVLEFSNDEALEQATIRDPQVRDIVIELLSSEKAINILSLEGRENLKNRIIERIDSMLQKGRVKEVYFTTVVVQ